MVFCHYAMVKVVMGKIHLVENVGSWEIERERERDVVYSKVEYEGE